MSILIAAASVAVVLVMFSNKGLLRRFMLDDELREKTARIEQLKSDITDLRKRRDLLQYDRKTIERVARETHGMVREGEIVYRVRPAKPSSVE